MQMIIDAALITKKSASLDYNTDSVNASGKIWPREIVHSESGIKAAGKSQGKPYYVLASAEAKGTAESAADLFKNCAASFSSDPETYSESIADFFRAFAQVLDKSGYDSSACDIAVFAGYEDRVFLAKTGKAKLYRFADGEFSEAKPLLFAHEDGAANYGVSAYSEVKPGDIFVLISGFVASAVSDSLVKAIVRNADGDIKKTVALIASNAVKNGCTDAVSAIILKVEQDDAGVDLSAVAAAPVILHEVDLVEDPEEEPTDPDSDSGLIEAESDEDNHTDSHISHREDYYDPSEEEIDKETAETAKINRYKSRNKFSRIAIIDICIVVAVIAVLIGILAVKGVFGSKSKRPSNNSVDISNILDDQDSTTKKKEDVSINDLEPDDDESTEPVTEEPSGQANPSTPAPVTQRPGGNQTPATTRSSTPTPGTTRAQPPVTDPTPPVTEQPPVTDPTPPVTEQPPVTDPTPPVTDPVVTTDPNIIIDD